MIETTNWEQAPRGYCVPCSIIDILRYHGYNKFDKDTLLKSLKLSNGRQGGFVEFKQLYSSELLKGGLIIEIKTSENEDNNTPDKTFNLIKEYVKKDLPIAVSFKSNPNSHIRVATDEDKDSIQFFEPQEKCERIVNFDLNKFKAEVSDNLDLLIIKKNITFRNEDVISDGRIEKTSKSKN